MKFKSCLINLLIRFNPLGKRSPSLCAHAVVSGFQSVLMALPCHLWFTSVDFWFFFYIFIGNNFILIISVLISSVIPFLSSFLSWSFTVPWNSITLIADSNQLILKALVVLSYYQRAAPVALTQLLWDSCMDNTESTRIPLNLTLL